jgi:hypothetical protein
MVRDNNKMASKKAAHVTVWAAFFSKENKPSYGLSVFPIIPTRDWQF